MESTLKWKPDLPDPSSNNWREAYGIGFEKHAQTSYQAPGKNPIPFIYENMKLSGGVTVDTSEYPFFGLWSSTTLNQKPQGITVSGLLRGADYITARNELIEALKLITTDDKPGYLNLPLWGRFPVIIVDWGIDETAKEMGQCKINLTFNRAGCPVGERLKSKQSREKNIWQCAEQLKVEAAKTFEKNLQDNVNTNILLAAFGLFKKALIGIVGRIQGSQRMLNLITNEVVGISNLIAQGVKTPKDLALALIGAAGKIVSGIYDIKNSTEETIAFFRIKDNEKNALFCFLPAYKYRLPMNAVTVKEVYTKKEIENLYKVMAYYASALLLPEVKVSTYDGVSNLFDLYIRLENSLDLNNPDLYSAVTSLRISVARKLAEKQLSQELHINLPEGVPILALAKYLGTDENILRSLNRIEDSFVIKGGITYV